MKGDAIIPIQPVFMNISRQSAVGRSTANGSHRRPECQRPLGLCRVVFSYIPIEDLDAAFAASALPRNSHPTYFRRFA
jgi:hypothetical protein